jgi:hypothetical protein
MRGPLCLIVAVLMVVLTTAGSARADILDTYQALARRHLSPVPLVPTTVPRSLEPADQTITRSTSRGRGSYSIRIVHYGVGGPDAVIALAGGEYKTLKAALHDFGTFSYRRHSTRVRGHRGYVLRRKRGVAERWLLWAEGGVIFSIGTGTPRKVSLEQLRATAAGLEQLGRVYIGSGPDPSRSDEGYLVTTQHTVSGEVTWEAQCVMPDGRPGSPRVGNAYVTLLRHGGDTFTFDIATYRVGEGEWTGTVSGSVGADGITLSVQATANIDGSACTSGPLTYTIPPLKNAR